MYRPTQGSPRDVDKRVLFGHPTNVKLIKPGPNEYMFASLQLSTAPPPVDKVSIPPTLGGRSFTPTQRKFLQSIFTLKPTSAYQRGYVYTTPYYLHSQEQDHHHMLRAVSPPQLSPNVVNGQYKHEVVPECMQMVPGVPFAFEIEGESDELHTIEAVHNLGVPPPRTGLLAYPRGYYFVESQVRRYKY